MNVYLTSKEQALIRQKVESGRFDNETDVVREGLRLLDEKDRLEYLRAAIAKADEEFARGEFTVWTETTMDEIQQEADEADALGLPISDDIKP